MLDSYTKRKVLKSVCFVSEANLLTKYTLFEGDKILSLVENTSATSSWFNTLNNIWICILVHVKKSDRQEDNRSQSVRRTEPNANTTTILETRRFRKALPVKILLKLKRYCLI